MTYFYILSGTLNVAHSALPSGSRLIFWSLLYLQCCRLTLKFLPCLWTASLPFNHCRTFALPVTTAWYWGRSSLTHCILSLIFEFIQNKTFIPFSTHFDFFSWFCVSPSIYFSCCWILWKRLDYAIRMYFLLFTTSYPELESGSILGKISTAV